MTRFGLTVMLAFGLTVRARMVQALDCATLPRPVYVTGSTAAKPLLAEIGRVLTAQSDSVTVIYLGQGSCLGVDAVVNGTLIKGAGATALSYWDKAGAEQKCDVSAQGVPADIGMSDVFANTCFRLPGGLPSNVADFLGPVQTMTFVVPNGSDEKAISAEAAYYVYGFGSDSGVDPWTDESAIIRRDENSGTQRMVAAAIGVDAARWKGTGSTSSDDLQKRLTAVVAKKAIGILSTDVAQDARSVLRVLAYQHTGQNCGYFPDRDDKSNEKINVRNGHYAIWGPLHLFTHVNNNGFSLNSAVGDVIGYLAGTKAAPGGLDLIYLEAQRHVVPPCAMQVRRTSEVGALMSFAPSGACGCYYEKVANGATTCQACSSNAECPASTSVCSYGYCETQ